MSRIPLSTSSNDYHYVTKSSSTKHKLSGWRLLVAAVLATQALVTPSTLQKAHAEQTSAEDRSLQQTTARESHNNTFKQQNSNLARMKGRLIGDCELPEFNRINEANTQYTDYNVYETMQQDLLQLPTRDSIPSLTPSDVFSENSAFLLDRRASALAEDNQAKGRVLSQKNQAPDSTQRLQLFGFIDTNRQLSKSEIRSAPPILQTPISTSGNLVFTFLDSKGEQITRNRYDLEQIIYTDREGQPGSRLAKVNIIKCQNTSLFVARVNDVEFQFQRSKIPFRIFFSTRSDYHSLRLTFAGAILGIFELPH